MKRKLLFFLGCLLCFSACAVLSVRAEETEGMSAASYEALLSDAEGEALLDAFTELLPSALQGKEASELLSARALFSLFFASVSEGADALLPTVGSLLALTVFSALVSILRQELRSPSHLALAEQGVQIVSALWIYRTFSSGMDAMYRFLSDILVLGNGMLPLMGSIFLMGGNARTAVAASTGVGTALLVTENLCIRTLPMLIRLSFAFALLGTLSKDVNFSFLGRTVRNVYMSILGFLSMILSSALVFGTSLASAADSVTARTVKYAIGNMIPLVGGTVNGAYGAVSASLSLVKQTMGAGAVAALLFLFLPILFYFIGARMLLSLAQDFGEFLSSDVASIYGGFRAVYDMALATLAFASVMFLLMLSVFLRCTVAVGT